MLYDYISKEDVKAIHESTLEILETIGVRTTSTRFMEACTKVGLKVENGTVYFPRDLVEKAIKTAPSQFSLYGRDGKHEVKLGSGEVYSQTCIGSPFILDIETGLRRQVVYQDLEDFVRVCDGLDDIDIISAIFPKDVPEHAAVTAEVVAQVKNTSKPLHICIESDHEVKYIADVLAAAVGGMDKLLAKPTAYLQVSPISPLDYAEGPANGLINTVEAGLPLGIIPCPMLGATGPMTLIGSVTMHNAEMLAGVVVAQLMKPGLPCIMSPRVTFIDMRTAVGLWAAPEMGLAGACSHQMAMYYGIPSEPTGFSCSAKVSDEQSGFERMYNALIPGIAGASILGTAGSIDNALIADYRTIVMDDEISSLVKRTVRGNKVDKDIMAVEAIGEVVNGERNFLGNEHTMRYLRSELWEPKLCQRNTYEGWKESGKTYHDKAQEKALDLYNNHVTEPLCAEYAKAVDDAYAKALNKE
ncbi:MAG: trimethylamine methyltransferase family protein [Clostridiales bacterium]